MKDSAVATALCGRCIHGLSRREPNVPSDFSISSTQNIRFRAAAQREPSCRFLSPRDGALFSRVRGFPRIPIWAFRAGMCLGGLTIHVNGYHGTPHRVFDSCKKGRRYRSASAGADYNPNYRLALVVAERGTLYWSGTAAAV